MKTKSIYKLILIGLFFISYNSVEAQPRKYHHHKKHSPHYRYHSEPHWGHAYKVVPRGYKVYSHKGTHYHYVNGVYYKPVGRTYVVVRPPYGMRINSLPASYVRFLINGRTYYYYYGTYYVKSNRDNEYISVAPPVGAQVDALPDGYRKVIIDDKVYYEFEGTYYKAFMYNDGEVWYEVVGEI